MNMFERALLKLTTNLITIRARMGNISDRFCQTG